MVKTAGAPKQIKFISQKSDDYKLEFVNGAISNITSRGEIVCDFHFESKDQPVEQEAITAKDGKTATLGPFKETWTYTRDVKFGIIINSSFAEALVILLNTKIAESKAILADKAKAGEQK
jgi:hypothetical protein